MNDHSITVVMAVNPSRCDVGKARLHLEKQVSKIPFLNPKSVFVDTITSLQSYNSFCEIGLPDSFDTDFVLLVQMDSAISNPDAWSNDFFRYDYIGAPWQPNERWLISRLTGSGKDIGNKDFLVGNGGFSLRSRRLCEFVKEKAKEKRPLENEDSYIAVTIRDDMENNGMSVAPYDVAKRFSVERDVYTGQFGVHKFVLENESKVMVESMDL